MPLAVQILQLAVVSIDPKYFATQCNSGGEDVVGDVDEDGGGDEEPFKLREEKSGRIAPILEFSFCHRNPLDKGATRCGLAQKTTIIFDILDILAQAEVNIQLQRSNDGCTAHGACDHK